MCSSTTMMEYRLTPESGTLTKITSSMGRSTTYDMPTEGEYCPNKETLRFYDTLLY